MDPQNAFQSVGGSFSSGLFDLLQQQRVEGLLEAQKQQELAAGQQKINLTAAAAARQAADDQQFDAALDQSGLPPTTIGLLKAAKKASGGVSIPWELIAPKPQAPPNSEFTGPDGSIAIWNGTAGRFEDQAGQPLPPGSVKRAAPAVGADVAADVEYQGLQKKLAAGTPLTSDEQATVTAYEKRKTLGTSPDAQADQQYETLQRKIAMNQPLTPDEQAAVTAYEKRKTLAPAFSFQQNEPVRAAAAGAQDAARLDKSYTQSTSALEQIRKPILDRAQRFSNLVATVGQGTPQADALVAPELLTVMAGGQGSGLRMNEAEIARIVGGRSAWQNLQAAMQHWAVDPSAANSITPDQRQQIAALIKTVGERTAAQSQLLDKAGSDLIDATTVEDHRRIVAGLHSDLDALLNGTLRAVPGHPGSYATLVDGKWIVR